jgi:hypothetical protein
VNSSFGAALAGHVVRSHVRARAMEAVCFLMFDPLDLETLMQIIPCWRFIGMRNRSLRDASANE